MSIVARPGMGKTTILYQLLTRLEASARTVFLFQTLCRPEDLLRSLLRDLGIVDNGGDVVRMQEQLNEVLLVEARLGRRVVVVIDEAQNLSDSVLELLRMLSNFETTRDKLMQIILAGQPQLREKLALPHLVQLRQRMSIFARLHPFTVEETLLYVRHRLRVAGYDRKVPLFTPRAEALIAKYSEGIPRNINNICFNALSLGCVLKQRSIPEEVVREVLDDLDIESKEAIDVDGGSAGLQPVASAAKKLSTSSRQTPWWRMRLAICAVLLLTLAWSAGGRYSPKELGSRSLLAVRANLQTDPKQSSYATAMNDGADYENRAGPAVNADLTDKHPSIALTDQSFRTAESVSSTPAQRSRQRAPQNSEPTSDPASLWAQVKKQNSKAEVELARIYLEGTSVPQNCIQAQVLLRAAARKGNTHASDLLNSSVANGGSANGSPSSLVSARALILPMLSS